MGCYNSWGQVTYTRNFYREQWRFEFAVDKLDGVPQWSACDTVGVLVGP